MKRTVEPHDIRAACEACGVCLEWLAFFVGIDEETLLSFVRGQTSLSAKDRLAIIQLLCASPCRKSGRPRRLIAERKKRLLDALIVLRTEEVEELKAAIRKRQGGTEAD
jgi:hypothetical protein